MKAYVKPVMDCEIFEANEFIAACYNCNVTVGKNEHLNVNVDYDGDGVGDNQRYNLGNTACGTSIDYPATYLQPVSWSYEEPAGRGKTKTVTKNAYFFIEADATDKTDYTKWHITDGTVSSNHS